LKAIYLAGGGPKNTAVKVMTQHLERLGHRVTRDAKDPLGWDATLRWGISYHGKKPALNAKVNAFNKMEALQEFAAEGIAAPGVLPVKWFHLLLEKDFPVLARRITHSKGKDIIVCKDAFAAELAAEVSDFFTPWIPTQTEYRVWVFRGRVLSVYEKVFKGEGEYTGYARNHRFGFKFEKRDDLREHNPLTFPAIKATRVLDMDFGAVDILLGKDGIYYVLEINSMPHIDSVERSSGIRLAAAVSKWVENA